MAKLSIEPLERADMTSPAPLLRPPIPGAGRQTANRPPRLGLSIPASPKQRPVNSAAAPPTLDTAAIDPLNIPPQLPKLNVAHPVGSSHPPPQTNARSKMRGPPLKIGTGQSGGGGGGSSDDSTNSLANSLMSSSNCAGSLSTTSSYSVNFIDMLRNEQDPQSAASSLYSNSSAHSGGVGMKREGSAQGLPDLEKLSLEKGRSLDVEDLDDAGWKVVKREGRIVELGSLGEGAGGAVTRCILKGGNTVFALKVRRVDGDSTGHSDTDDLSRSSPRTLIQMSRNRSSGNCHSTNPAPRHISANITALSPTTPPAPLASAWNFAKGARSTASIARSRNSVAVPERMF